MNTLVLVGAVILGTSAAVWIGSGLLVAAAWPVAHWGASVNQALKRPTGSDADIWLFALLVGVTRWVSLLLIGLTVATALAAQLLPISLIFKELSNTLLNVLVAVLIMRYTAFFMGGLLLGGSVRSVVKTLGS